VGFQQAEKNGTGGKGRSAAAKARMGAEVGTDRQGGARAYRRALALLGL